MNKFILLLLTFLAASIVQAQEPIYIYGPSGIITVEPSGGYYYVHGSDNSSGIIEPGYGNNWYYHDTTPPRPLIPDPFAPNPIFDPVDD
jgi:hypothetical protein